MTFTEGNTKKESELVRIFKELLEKYYSPELAAQLKAIEYAEIDLANDARAIPKRLVNILRDIENLLPPQGRKSPQYVRLVKGVQAFAQKEHAGVHERLAHKTTLRPKT